MQELPQQKQIKLSAAIICKNEENSIGRCLESLIGIDEIIIIDTGSEDKTRDVIKKFQESDIGKTEVRYYENDYKWNDDFAAARNHANSKCAGDWIFVIDCDCVLKTSFEQIKKEIELAEKEGNQSVQVCCYDENSPTNHWLPLIYKNDPKIFWSGRVHNHLSANPGRKGEIRIDYWYSDSHAKDPDRSFRILKKVVEENPNCGREKFYLAREYWYRQDYITAVHWYKKYLSISTFGPEMADAYLTMARCYWQMQEGDLARACCLEAIGLNTNFKEALLFMAEMSGPGNKKRWLEFSETSTNESVLFVRTKSMPTSRPNHLSYLTNRVLELQPKSILDIGIGFGAKGMLFREMTDIWNLRYDKKDWKTKIDGVEIFEKYIGNLQREIYDNIFIGDVLKMELRNYDLIYLGDIIEHFTKEEGLELLNKLKGKHIIVATPLVVSSQGEILGNLNETHKSQWTAEDFKGAEVKVIGNTLIAEFNKKVYYCEAMKTFGEKMGMERYSPTDADKPVFFQGLYFDEDYEVFKNHKGRKEVFWNGSDVLRLSPERVSILKQFQAVHTCHNKQLQDELANAGIEAAIKPIFFGDIDDYPISYKHSDTPQVYMTCNEGREEEYGVPQVLEVAKELPEIKFHIYGINGQNTENVIYHGWVEQMDEEIKDFQGCIRLCKHDGNSQSVMKAILMGLYPIKDLAELKFLKDKKEPNNLREELIKSL